MVSTVSSLPDAGISARDRTGRLVCCVMRSISACNCGFEKATLLQIVYFHQSNARGAVYTAHDRGVVACRQVCNDRRFSSVPRCVTAVLDFLHLVMGDNSADDRSLPIIIAANQGARAIMQFQGRILQRIGNAILTELRANGADDHSLGLRALDDKSSDHHVVARLHKGAGTD